jgi:flagellar export protein FliJ
MPRFVFKLDGVLRQRQHIEKQRQRQVAVLQAQMARLQEDLRQINAAAEQSTNELRGGHLVGRLDMGYLAAHRRYMLAVQRQAMQLVQRMALLQKQIEEAQRSLADAAKGRKAMEKLKENHHARWQADQDRHESLILDEVTVQLRYAETRDAEARVTPDGEAAV